jgi:hypothetical protein
MLIRNSYCLVLATILILSCDRNTANQGGANNIPARIDITTPSDSLVFNLSYLASHIEYIPLKTVEKVSIFKIVASSERIYIDAGIDLLCFSNNGNLLFKLSSVKTSPEGTFSSVNDFDISSDESTLVILSYNRVLIFRNTGSTFEYQKTIILKKPLPSLISLVPGSKEILLSYKPIKGSEPVLSLLISSDGDTITCRPNRYRYKLPLMLSERINHYKTGNYLCFNDPYSDTVFFVSKGADYFKTRLILDSKERTYNNWNFKTGIYLESEFIDYYSIEKVFELPGKIFFYNTVFYPKMQRRFNALPYNITRKIIYDPLTSKKMEIPFSRELVDDLTGGPDFSPEWISNGKLYSTVFLGSLKKHTESSYFSNATVQDPQKKEGLKNLADSLEETENPILIAVTLKTN